MLLEQKIQMEQETQEALDPHYGREEIEGMRREISRMQAKHDLLQKQQERMSQEMVLMVEKHGALRTSQSSSKPKASTAASLSSKLQNTKNSLKQYQKELKLAEFDVRKILDESRLVDDRCQHLRMEVKELDQRRTTLLNTNREIELSRRMNTERVRNLQNTARLYEDLANGKLKPPTTSFESLSSSLSKQTETYQNLRLVLGRLRLSSEKYAPSLDQMMAVQSG